MTGLKGRVAYHIYTKITLQTTSQTTSPSPHPHPNYTPFHVFIPKKTPKKETAFFVVVSSSGFPSSQSSHPRRFTKRLLILLWKATVPPTKADCRSIIGNKNCRDRGGVCFLDSVCFTSDIIAAIHGHYDIHICIHNHVCSMFLIFIFRKSGVWANYHTWMSPLGVPWFWKVPGVEVFSQGISL